MIDLHMHNRYSDDGEVTPYKLIEQRAKKLLINPAREPFSCLPKNNFFLDLGGISILIHGNASFWIDAIRN